MAEDGIWGNGSRRIREGQRLVPERSVSEAERGELPKRERGPHTTVPSTLSDCPRGLPKAPVAATGLEPDRGPGGGSGGHGSTGCLTDGVHSPPGA